MDEIIINLMMSISTSSEWLDNVTSLLTRPPQDFFNSSVQVGTMNIQNENIYNIIVLINDTVRITFGYPILIIFFFMDLISKSITFENLNHKVILKVLLKFVIAKMVLDNTLLILETFFDLSSYLASTINQVVSSDISNTDAILNEVKITSIVNDTHTLVKPLVLACLGIVKALMFIITVLITLIVFGRTLTLFIYTALAPIPIATLSSEQFTQTGKRFFQKFASVCLRSTIMLVILIIYQTLIGNNLILNDPDNLGDYLMQCLTWIVFSTALFAVLFKTSGIANDLVGAN